MDFWWQCSPLPSATLSRIFSSSFSCFSFADSLRAVKGKKKKKFNNRITLLKEKAFNSQTGQFFFFKRKDLQESPVNAFCH